MGYLGETEKHFNERIKAYEDDVKKNHPEVIWVNAEEYAKKHMRQDSGFYGHFLPSHFKKTSIISTHGR